MYIYIKFVPGSKKIRIEVEASDTILYIKGKIEAECKISAQWLMLEYRGRKLMGNSTLADYYIEKGAIINVFLMMRGD